MTVVIPICQSEEIMMSVHAMPLNSVSGALIVSASCILAASAEDKTLIIREKWSGVFPVGRLHVLPAEQRLRRVGYLDNQKLWTATWQAWKPQQKQPQIDFDKQIIVFIKNVRFLNRLSRPTASLKQATLLVRAAETRSARPIRNQVFCLMFPVPRSGITAITDGKEPQLKVKTDAGFVTQSNGFPRHSKPHAPRSGPKSVASSEGRRPLNRNGPEFRPLPSVFFRAFPRGND